MAEYSLADLTRITGLKPRTVQVWSETGVIHAREDTERRGTGVHRRFDHDEALLACVLSAISGLGLSIGIMLQISRSLRGNFDLLRPALVEASLGKPKFLAILWSELEEEGGGITTAIVDKDVTVDQLSRDYASDLPLLVALHLHMPRIGTPK